MKKIKPASWRVFYFKIVFAPQIWIANPYLKSKSLI